jgi:hypothetical protein
MQASELFYNIVVHGKWLGLVYVSAVCNCSTCGNVHSTFKVDAAVILHAPRLVKDGLTAMRCNSKWG